MFRVHKQWLRPGEILWASDIDDRKWSLTYLSDNGQAWSLELREERAGSRSSILTYEYDKRALSDRDSPPEASLKVFSVLNDVLAEAFGVVVASGSLHQQALDALTAHLRQDEWMDGKLLRRALEPAAKAQVMAAVAELTPRYVEQLSIEGDPVDHFRVTLAGALRSSESAWVAQLIESVLKLCRQKYDADPIFPDYTWEEVKTAARELDASDCMFSRGVITIAGLAFGGRGSPSDFRWAAPKDVEYLSELQSFPQFLDYLRSGANGRVSPTAPLRLPAQEPITATVAVPDRNRGTLIDLPDRGTFISYSHDDEQHKRWVLELAERLKRDGIAIILDRWHLNIGDEVAQFMERAIDGSAHVLIICTKRYKERADSRKGGVGYEESIITDRIARGVPGQRFVPVWRGPEGLDAAPTWARGRLACDLRGDRYREDEYQQLLRLLRPSVLTIPSTSQAATSSRLLERLQRLLQVAATAPHLASRFHTGFPRLVDQMTEDEARILAVFAREPQQEIYLLGWDQDLLEAAKTLMPSAYRLGADLQGLTDIAVRAGCESPQRLSVYVKNLERLGLIEREAPTRQHMVLNPPDFLNPLLAIPSPPLNRRLVGASYLRLTDFGRDFCACCLGEPLP